MKRIELRISLKVRSPFLFPDTSPAGFGVDAAPMRNAAGQAIIPQDQIRGVLRHAVRDVLTNLGNDTLTDDWLFGTGAADAIDEDENASADHFKPGRGRLHFSDLAARKDMGPDKSATTMRVAIDPDTGTAKEGALVFYELAAPLADEVEFSGSAILFATDDEWEQRKPVLSAAPTWVSSIGAMKSAGFGAIVDGSFTISEYQRTELIAGSLSAQAAESVRFQLKLDRPFLVNAQRVAQNAYQGTEVIPGSVLKGALAEKLRLAGKLSEVRDSLTALSISHAVRKGQSPALPLSLYSMRGDSGNKPGISIHDALLTEQGSGPVADGTPGVFQTDWKTSDWETACEAAGHAPLAPLPRDQRTHVKILQKTGTAEESQLFLYDAVIPEGEAWTFKVDFSRVADSDHRAIFAGALRDGLFGLGKTGARADVSMFSASSPSNAVKPISGYSNWFAVVMVSEAVMASPDDGKTAWEAYQKYWRRICPGATLKNFFATQRLAGGYVGRRFRSGSGYQPFWLTEPGSVFMLQGDIAKDLNGFLTNRLPAPEINGQKTDWESCPFQPENGYGEIRLDYDPASIGGQSNA